MKRNNQNTQVGYSHAEYITKMLDRAKGKKYENYVINRIWHKLDRTDVDFRTQQTIYIQQKKSHYFVDLYLPQINMIVEINEAHHKLTKLNDTKRNDDILEVLGKHKIRHIDIGTKTLEKINYATDIIIADIKKLLSSTFFIPFDYKEEFDYKKFLQIGKLDVKNNPKFRTHEEALKCFGYKKGHIQRATWRIPDTNDEVWFPKLDENSSGWINKERREYIFERHKNKSKTKKNIECYKNKKKSTIERRIVFGYDKDKLGQELYRFKGIYKLSPKESSSSIGIAWKRISTEYYF